LNGNEGGGRWKGCVETVLNHRGHREHRERREQKGITSRIVAVSEVFSRGENGLKTVMAGFRWFFFWSIAMTAGFKVMSMAGCLVAGLVMSVAAFAADPVPTTKPAGAYPACCGDKCKAMGMGGCSVDEKGAMKCAMGGGGCVKRSTETKPADAGK
jgi:hypothetical protein